MANDQSSSGSWLERLLTREPKTRGELLTLLREAHTRKLFDISALRMIESVLDVEDMQVRDIMIPRNNVVMIENGASLTQIIPMIINSAHSRFPVTGESRDEVIGILHAKDLLQFTFNKELNFDLSSVLRPAVFVPESKRLSVLLEEFRSKHNHMAIVSDEYGGVAGIVTIEDVLEQIVGEIEDEFDIDDASANIKKITEKHFQVLGLAFIEDFNETFNTQLSDEEFDTIGCLITHHFGHLPEVGEKITIHKMKFEVMAADNRRIKLLKVTLPD